MNEKKEDILPDVKEQNTNNKLQTMGAEQNETGEDKSVRKIDMEENKPEEIQKKPSQKKINDRPGERKN